MKVDICMDKGSREILAKDHEYEFCEGCAAHGEPNGCNRGVGSCHGYRLYLDTIDALDNLSQCYRLDIAARDTRIAQLEAEVERVGRERDAAVEMLESVSIVPDREVCGKCKFYAKCENGQVNKCDNFQWRGTEEG